MMTRPEFCSHCGGALGEKATSCPACGKPVPMTADLLNKQALEDAKASLASFASRVKETAAKASNELAEEAQKINQVRVESMSEQGQVPPDQKVRGAAATAQSFWRKLTNRQKVLLLAAIILPLLLAVSCTGSGIDADAKKSYKLACDAIAIKGETLEEIIARATPSVEFNKKMDEKYTSPEDLKAFNESLMKYLSKGCGFD